MPVYKDVKIKVLNFNYQNRPSFFYVKNMKENW